jgi:D-threo-aldose 1-dehydrogenase
MTAWRRIGATQLSVSPLGFGAAAIGNLYQPIDEREAQAAVAAALANGLAYFDTAPHYGFGLSERRLGEALLRHDGGAGAIISTKVGRLLEPVADEAAGGERHGFVDAAPFEPKFDYSYDGVMRSFEESRVRLQRDRIDILYAHDLGAVTHGADHERRFAEFIEGGYRAMCELRTSGDVGAIGLGANEWQICEQAMQAGEFDLFLLAGRYTLLEQTALDSFLPQCEQRGISVVIGGPYNSGILATGTKSGATLHYDYEPAPDSVVARVRLIEEVCGRHGVRLAAAALQFPLAHPQVAAVIPGLASAAQVEQSMALYLEAIPMEFWTEMRSHQLMHPQAPVPGAAQ